METIVLLVVVIVASLLVMVMVWAFVRNAIRLKRDIDRRFDLLRDRLEGEANAALDPLLKTKSGDDRPR